MGLSPGSRLQKNGGPTGFRDGHEAVTIAGVGSLLSPASARESFDFSNFRLGEAGGEWRGESRVPRVQAQSCTKGYGDTLPEHPQPSRRPCHSKFVAFHCAPFCDRGLSF